MKLKILLTPLVLGSMLATTAQAEISYQHIHNATAKIQYGEATFLVDPYLAPKGTYAGFAGTKNSEKRNPLIEFAEPFLFIHLNDDFAFAIFRPSGKHKILGLS